MDVLESRKNDESSICSSSESSSSSSDEEEIEKNSPKVNGIKEKIKKGLI